MPVGVTIGIKLAFLSVVQPVISKVISLFETETDRFWDVDNKLKELKVAYSVTQTQLSKLDSTHVYETTLKGFLHDLNRYCYDIEDIVDYLAISFQTKEDDSSPYLKNIINSLEIKIPHQIGELQEKLQGLNSLIEQLLKAGAINAVESQNGGKALYSKSLYDKTPLVDGTSRDEDKKNVFSKLISQQSKHCGVSIIGMDGLGKTSLARTILLDQSTKEHFPVVLSACVSDHFKMEEVVQKLVEDHLTRTQQHISTKITEQEISTKKTEQQIPPTLEQVVCSGKTLIILDDIWSVNDEDWDRFKSNYLSSCPGWRILTTTRNPKVAEATESHSFYLDRMTDEDCKKLIEHRVSSSIFKCDVEPDVLMVIAKKCMGIPVLANNVGLKLSKKQTAVKRKNCIIQLEMNELWDLKEFREVLPSLNLNEPKLPPDLKRCFSYCSIFPASREFNQDELIQLWEVEGFTQTPQTERSGQGMNYHFEDMLSRSILIPSTDEKQTVYKMHEFNHEFARLLASKAICILEEGTDNLPLSSKSLRHLSLACHNTDEPLLSKIGKCERLRTFLLLHDKEPKTRIVSNNFFDKLHKLRLLDLSHTIISDLNKVKFLSKHLRFLDLSYSSIKKLPNSICTIPALRILKLKGCRELKELSKHFHCLTNLTHLHVDMKELERPPSNIGKLTKLEVLDSFSVSVDKTCRAVELRDMKHLKKIHMFRLENIRNKQEAQETMLSEKMMLKILVLEWTSDTLDNASDVLEGLKPHSHLEDLAVMNYAGENFPEWLVSKSCQIASFKLEDCPNCEELPSLSQLPFLTNLVFRSIDKVKTLDDQFCQGAEKAYPCLELLEFHDMKALEKWSGLKSGNMPLLSTLKIVNCPMLINLPSFVPLLCLINLEINNCPALLSLPDLPQSMNTYSGKLIINESKTVALRCEPEGADWPKIKDIPHRSILLVNIEENIEATVSMDEDQPPMLENRNIVTQTRANESTSEGKQKKKKRSFSNNLKRSFSNNLKWLKDRFK